ncbi:hypothetical protein H6F90_29300 [Trichocoleus sp. FACHB-591]|nr:hypothetical protein [Trichocoleus sp. FACHB-591]MBD2099164.1 hypothetical protein [Trichocoleus sp. FACHB-591]
MSIGGNSSFLGAPQTDELGCPDGVGRFNHFQGGSIYWTPATGAQLIYGSIREKWASMGWETSLLGYPVTDELGCPDGVGRFNHFQGGSIYWTPQTGAQLIYGSIREKWASMGWETSLLGYPVTDELGCPDGVGRFNHFQGGSIYWTPNTGAQLIYGSIREKWASMGWENSFLGYPVTDELGCPDGVGRFNHFQGGSIYWTPNTGAHFVLGAIRDAWASQGWETGSLGYPRTDELVTEGTNGQGRHSIFEGGEIYWTPAGGAKVKLYQTNVEIWFSGFRCLNESSEWSGSDEPYMFLGVSTSGQAQTPHETGVISVDKGTVIRSATRLYSGVAEDVILAVVIRELDEGDPHAFSGAFRSILEVGNTALKLKTGASVPSEVVKLISNKLSELVGAGDDDVGRRAELLTKDNLIRMARQAESGDPVADFTWDLGSDSEGIYRLYFFVRKV